MSEGNLPPVLGHLVELDSGRLVFLGTREGEDDSRYLGFRSADGRDTKLRLSLEAFNALVALAIAEPGALERVPFPAKAPGEPKWRLVAWEDDLKKILAEIGEDKP